MTTKTLTAAMWKRIEAHYGRPCELNEQGEIVYRNQNFPVGYIATQHPYDGWLVDTTYDSDKVVLNLNRTDA